MITRSDPRVALYQGASRTTNLRCALDLVLEDIDWLNRRHVVVKPNLVMVERAQAITHRDALAAVLEAIRCRYTGRLTIAEGCALHPTVEAFDAQGYDQLATFYNARLCDLNADEVEPVTVYSRDAHPLKLRMARTILQSDCRVSLGLPKTHDAVLVTLTIKNMIMGGLVNRRLIDWHAKPAWLDRIGQIARGHGDGWGSDKVAMHQSYPIINLNLALLAPLVLPHLSVLDGFVAMEGAGPVEGTPVPWGIALAGADALAVDTLAARLMGFELGEIGYLSYCAELGLGCADLDQIQIVGNVAPAAVARSFTPHPRHAEQRRWQQPDAAHLLQRVATA
jgi:uncharacterized protein (DUF362 family)